MDERALQTAGSRGLVVNEHLPLDQQPAAVYLVGLGAGSRRAMGGALATIAGILTGTQAERAGKRIYRFDPLLVNWAALRFQHTAAIRARLVELYAPRTVNKMLSALRGALKAAWRLGQMSADDYHRASSVENVEIDTLPAGRDIAQGELAAIMLACADQAPVGIRDAAIIGILYVCGLRRSELVNLDLADHDPDGGSLHVRKAKRNKERVVYATNGAAEALGDWLAIRGDKPGPLFVPVLKGGHVRLGQRMTEQAVWKRVKYRAKQAGVKDLSPHDFRRTVAGDLLEAGADLVTVTKILGHSDPKTTARYDRRPEETKRKAAQKLHLPYYRQTLRVAGGEQ